MGAACGLGQNGCGGLSKGLARTERTWLPRASPCCHAQDGGVLRRCLKIGRGGGLLGYGKLLSLCLAEEGNWARAAAAQRINNRLADDVEMVRLAHAGGKLCGILAAV